MSKERIDKVEVVRWPDGEYQSLTEGYEVTSEDGEITGFTFRAPEGDQPPAP